MKKTALLRISVPADAQHPIHLVTDALERYCGTTYPIWVAPLDDDPVFADTSGAIVVEQEDPS